MARMQRLAGWVASIGLIAIAACEAPEGGPTHRLVQRSADEPSRTEISATASEEMPPVDASTYIASGRLHESKLDFPAALDQYRKGVLLDPENADARHRLGTCLCRVGEFRKAETQLRKAVELAPNAPHLRNNLAFVYINQRRWDDAEAELRNALELYPDFARARVNLGLVLAQRGDYEGALEAFRVVLHEPDALFNIGLLYRAHGKYEKAAESFRLALEKNPHLVAAEKQLTILEPYLREARAHRVAAEALARSHAEGEDEAAASAAAGSSLEAEPQALTGKSGAEDEPEPSAALAPMTADADLDVEFVGPPYPALVTSDAKEPGQMHEPIATETSREPAEPTEVTIATEERADATDESMAPEDEIQADRATSIAEPTEAEVATNAEEPVEPAEAVDFAESVDADAAPKVAEASDAAETADAVAMAEHIALGEAESSAGAGTSEDAASAAAGGPAAQTPSHPIWPLMREPLLAGATAARAAARRWVCDFAYAYRQAVAACVAEREREREAQSAVEASALPPADPTPEAAESAKPEASEVLVAPGSPIDPSREFDELLGAADGSEVAPADPIASPAWDEVSGDVEPPREPISGERDLPEARPGTEQAETPSPVDGAIEEETDRAEDGDPTSALLYPVDDEATLRFEASVALASEGPMAPRGAITELLFGPGL